MRSTSSSTTRPKPGDELYDLSQKVNFSVESLSALKNSAETSGGSIETVVSSLSIFNKNLGQSDEEGKKVNTTLKALNVTATDQEAIFRQVFKALYDLRGTYQQNEYAQALFGKGAKDVLGIINQSEGSFDALIARYRELGTLITTQAAREAQDYKDAMAGVRQQLEGVEREIGSQLLPTAMRALSTISKALKDNRQDIKGWSSEAIEAVSAFSSLLRPFLDLEAVLARIAVNSSGLIQLIRLIKAPGEFYAGTETGVAQDTTLQGLRSLKALQDAIKSGYADKVFKTGGEVNVPEELQYKQKFSDDVVVRAQEKAAEQARKEAEAASKRAMDKAAGEGRREQERQAGAVKKLADEYRSLSSQVEHFNDSEVEQRIATARLNSGVESLTGEYRKQAEALLQYSAQQMRDLDVKQKIKDAAEEAARQLERDAEFTTRAKDTLGELIGQERTHVQEIELFILAGLKQGTVLDANMQKMLLLAAAGRDATEALEKLAEAGGLGLGVNPDFKLPQANEKGPWVNPAEMEAPPPPNFDPWRQAVSSLKDHAVSSFKGIGQAMGQAAAASLVYGQSFGKAMKQALAATLASIAAESLVRAVYETALGFAALAGFLPGPAALHFKAAALFGAVGLGAGIAGSAFAAGGQQSAFGGGEFGGSAGGFASSNQNTGPRVVEQSRNTELRHVVILRVEPTPYATVTHIKDDVRKNGELRGLIVETAAA